MRTSRETQGRAFHAWEKGRHEHGDRAEYGLFRKYIHRPVWLEQNFHSHAIKMDKDC